MHVRKHFNVLLVDDEADVLSISKIALRHIRVWDIPLKIHTATSKAEAMEFVKAQGPIPDLSLAIIDVVMETDTAGLELCKFIRSDCNNQITPLVVRTGQAGKAPERDVIDRFDISQYITKVEATEDRLYTIVKSSLRQFVWGRLAQALTANTNFLIEKARSRETLLAGVRQIQGRNNVDRAGAALTDVETHHCYFIDDHVIGCGDYADMARAKEARRALQSTAPLVTTAAGTLRRSGDQVLLSPPNAAKGAMVEMLGRTTFDPVPDFQMDAFLGFCQTLQRLWSLGSV
ncbi:MAG TPA: response regulator [Labilithrix sp.]|nr:response regulator [Labilithrix sp.]